MKDISIATKSPDNSLIMKEICDSSPFLGFYETNERTFSHLQDISSTITSLHIAPQSVMIVQMDCFDLQRFPKLESFVMESENCPFVKSFVCENHNNIKSISIDRSFYPFIQNFFLALDDMSDLVLQINHNPLLESIYIGDSSFTFTSIVTIQGMFGWI